MTLAVGDHSELFDQLDALVHDELRPNAAETDRSDIFPRNELDAIARLGLFGMAAPVAAGGLGLTPAQTQRVLRMVSSGCGVSAFAFAQHHGTTAAVASTKNTELQDRWLKPLLTDTLAATAFGHARRPGPPVLRAIPDGDGWRLVGSAPWVTSWGHAEVMSIAALTDDGRVVWPLLPACEGNGISVSKHFDLVVYQAASTVALRFDETLVTADDVLSVVDLETWAARDRLLAARPSPMCLGVGDRALVKLEQADPSGAAAWSSWFADEAAASDAQCLLVDQAVADRIGPEEAEDLIGATARRRTQVMLAVQRLTTALLSISGGSAMDLSHPAQRLAREAMFYVVQGQSGDGKVATLGQLTP